MTKITKPPVREIIEDFAKEIAAKKQKGPKPQTHIIAFRDDEHYKREREVYLVPIELLRYRKDNGRICSDVLNFEKNNYLLREDDEDNQKIIKRFLEEKDKEKTEELEKSIQLSGQRDPAIITCDGFLINGNRRKVVFEKLLDSTHDNSKYGSMKVVILPNHGGEGGAPTLKEIEQLENRYQLQSDGKAEYYGFDRALSIRRKINLGMNLEEQLKDDPRYVNLIEKEFNKVVKDYENEYLKPLECVDRYLASIGREGFYGLISTGVADRQGKWQAFLDYNNYVHTKLNDDNKRIDLGVSEDEKGDIEDLSYKIIRMREFPDIKVHQLMRLLPKMLKNEDSKKELMKLTDVDNVVPDNLVNISTEDESYEKKVEEIWRKNNARMVVGQVMKAKKLYENRKEKETPLTLLEGALKKLNHDQMDIKAIGLGELNVAMGLTKKIQEIAHGLESEIYHWEKEAKELWRKKKS
ncbi:MAG: hypothetical protein M0R20_04655 [Candidatus Omnitrophica bacterium]|jgi:hypothetical protein|nr:hypothetical protein [Candidatus Omnitrophota bacterium]